MFSPRVPHEYYPISGRWRIYFFVFSGNAAEDIFSYFGFDDAEVFTGCTKEIKETCETLCKNDDPFSQSFLIYGLLGKISKLRKMDPSRTDVEKTTYGKILPVCDYIENNYKEPITLDDMADLIGVSKSYLCRIFKEAHGMTPVNYLMRIRISKAKRLLISTDMKIKFLSEECGFNDSSYFCMIFRRMEGMTPDEFRSVHTD